jgi:histidine triad (HIT) family protein
VVRLHPAAERWYRFASLEALENRMADCLFCRIADGGVPAELVYESPGAVAFLDRFPSARGHTLVVPRIHAATLLDLPDEAVGDVFRGVKTVMRKVRDGLKSQAFNVGWNHGAAAGQHVFHLHVHVLPRYTEGGPGVQALGTGADRGDLAQVAAAIRAA